MEPLWKTEPDQWWAKFGSLDLVICRHSLFKTLCGYIGVPKGTRLSAATLKAAEFVFHGGVTYEYSTRNADYRTDESVLLDFLAKIDKDKDWYGFDCNHSSDYAPGIETFGILENLPVLRRRHSTNVNKTYKSLGFCITVLLETLVEIDGQLSTANTLEIA